MIIFHRRVVPRGIIIIIPEKEEEKQTIAKFLWRHKISIFWQVSQSIIIIILKTEEYRAKTGTQMSWRLLRHKIKSHNVHSLHGKNGLGKLLLKMCKVRFECCRCEMMGYYGKGFVLWFGWICDEIQQYKRDFVFECIWMAGVFNFGFLVYLGSYKGSCLLY